MLYFYFLGYSKKVIYNKRLVNNSLLGNRFYFKNYFLDEKIECRCQNDGRLVMRSQ